MIHTTAGGTDRKASSIYRLHTAATVHSARNPRSEGQKYQC